MIKIYRKPGITYSFTLACLIFITAYITTIRANECTTFTENQYCPEAGNTGTGNSIILNSVNSAEPYKLQGSLTDHSEDQALKDYYIALHLRNLYFNRHYAHPQASHLKNPSWHQWAQGLIVDFQSDYIGDWLGMDASLFGAIKIDGTNPQGAGGNQLLHTIHHGKKYSSSYGKIGLLNIRTKLFNTINNFSTVIRYGLIKAESAFTHECSARLFPATYRGASISGYFNMLHFYGYYLDRIGFPSSNNYDRFINGQGKSIDSLTIAGVAYTWQSTGLVKDSLYLNAEIGRSTDYLQGYFGQLTYQQPRNNNLSANIDDYWLANIQYRYSEKAGNRWDAGKRPPGSSWCWRCLPASKASSLSSNTGTGWFDQSAQNINFNLKTRILPIELSASYTYTQAKSSGSGANSHKFHYALVGNDCGMGTFWTARQVSSFNYDGENTWQGNINYIFSGFLQGLSTGITHTYGSGINRQTGLANEQETDIALQYDVQHPALKGLSFAVNKAYYVSRERTGNSYGTRGYRLNDLHAYVSYTVNVF